MKFILHNFQRLIFVCLLLISSAAAAQRDCNIIAGNTPAYLGALTQPVSAKAYYRYDVIRRIPHDSSAFTQGLVYFQGKLFESAGLSGHSSLRRMDPETGEIEQLRKLPDGLFAEGLVLWKHRLLQLTWKSGTVFSYAPNDLNQFTQFNYEGEAWGVTALQEQLVISDGSSTLHILDSADLHKVKTLSIIEKGASLMGLNELETADGLIYANIYPTDCVAIIDPQVSQVIGWLDLSGLMPLSERIRTDAVTNGIAYNPDTHHWYVTGKLWPYIYEIKLRRTDVVSNSQFESQ